MAYVDNDPVAVLHSNNSQSGPRIFAHSWDQITALFDGLDLMPPGIVDTAAWRPGRAEGGLAERSTMIVGGVGRKNRS